MSPKSNEEKIFTFSWSIENFSMCSRQRTEFISSPVFTSAILNDAEFVLKLFPGGNKDDLDLSCSLVRVDDGSDDVTVTFVLWVVDTRNSTSIVDKSEGNHTFNATKKTWTFEKFASYDDIMLYRYRYLPNDVLTVKCRLWLSDSKELSVNANSIIETIKLPHLCCDEPDSEHSTVLPSESEAKIKALRKKFCPFTSESFGRTRLLLEKNSFRWDIKNFSNCIHQNQKLYMTLPTLTPRAPNLMVVLYLTDDSIEDEAVSVEIHKTKETVESNFIKLKIAVVGTLRSNPTVEREESHTFSPEKSLWKYPALIKKNMLTTDKDSYLPSDVLTLKCELAVSKGVETSWNEETRYLILEYQNLLFAIDSDSRNLKSDFIRLYEDQELCDVILVVQKHAFHAHKAVLFARSDVFKAMFCTNMKEKDTNVVKIKDIAADTLKSMLKFMYSDTLDTLDFESAIKLYGASDKYEVLKLKEMCSDFLKKNVSLLNVYNLLLLAYMHRDTELQTMAINFICIHKNKILLSDEWLQFMKSRPKLSRLVLYQICIKLPDM